MSRTVPATPARDEAWAKISDQMAALREGMRERGLQYVVAGPETTKGGLSIGTASFRTGVSSNLEGEEILYGPTPAMVELREVGAEGVHVHGWGSDECSLQFAARVVLHNVSSFVRATEPDEIRGLDMKIAVDGGLLVTILGDEVRTWEQPDRTQTGQELKDWLEREIDKLHESLGDRFERIAQTWVNDLAARWPGLNPEIVVGNGDLFVRADRPDHGRVLLNNMRFEEMDEIWPGLSDEIDRMDDLLSEIETIFALPGTETLVPQDVSIAPEEDECPQF